MTITMLKYDHIREVTKKNNKISPGWVDVCRILFNPSIIFFIFHFILGKYASKKEIFLVFTGVGWVSAYYPQL